MPNNEPAIAVINSSEDTVEMLRASMNGRKVVVTTTNKRALEQLIGQKTDAHEIGGKPYDLQGDRRCGPARRGADDGKTVRDRAATGAAREG